MTRFRQNRYICRAMGRRPASETDSIGIMGNILKTAAAILAAVLMTFAVNSPAQSRKERMPEPKPMLGYEVVNGDTLYFDIINPSKVTSFRKMKGREWRRYYRLVWNFSKTYPYALVARKLIEKTDAELEENDFSRRKGKSTSMTSRRSSSTHSRSR